MFLDRTKYEGSDKEKTATIKTRQGVILGTVKYCYYTTGDWINKTICLFDKNKNLVGRFFKEDTIVTFEEEVPVKLPDKAEALDLIINAVVDELKRRYDIDLKQKEED